MRDSAIYGEAAPALRVLLIEDSREDADGVQRALARSRAPRFSLQVATSWHEARSQLASTSPDVVLLDLHLPDAAGPPLVQDLVATAGSVPFVVLTGLEEDALALQALQLGAQDYLVKSDLGTSALCRSLCHAVERKRIARALEIATRQRLEAQFQLLSLVSHELLTPLSAIYQFLDILHDTIDSDEPARARAAQQHRCVEILRRNATHLRRMIGDLMDATRLETGKLTLDLDVLHLRGTLASIAQTAAPELERAGLALDCEIEDHLPEVVADAGRVEQVVANLLSNAIKFTERGGRIRLRATRHDEDPEYVQVTVSDSGCGIDEKSLPLVFKRFWQDRGESQVSRKGLGLGLYLCQELIAQLGGKIWAQSTRGEGSCFHFTLPAHSTARMLQRVDPCAPVALLTIAIESTAPGPDPAPGFGDLVEELHGALSRLVLHEFDVVLPRRRGGSRELLGVVAQTDAQGAAALRQRFERAIAGLCGVIPTAVRTQLEVWPLDPAPGTRRSCAELGRTVDDRLRRLRFPEPTHPLPGGSA
jgi:signal transduction histidine kinase